MFKPILCIIIFGDIGTIKPYTYECYKEMFVMKIIVIIMLFMRNTKIFDHERYNYSY